MIKLFSLTLLIFSNIATATCTIEDVVDLYDDGYSNADIKEECHRRVIGSDCSISRIIGYAESGRGLSSIQRRCRAHIQNDRYNSEPYTRPQPISAKACFTPYGSCPMRVSIPQGFSCFCQTQMGPVAGIAR